ncbi:uncharacterized protein [Diadema setosum]|uniref:uncharacterized protein n=1 Tax=Diadema setosum TaxID=31175 RepID=UPI003B3AB689
MENQVEQDNAGNKFKSFFTSLKHRARISLLCSSSSVVPFPDNRDAALNEQPPERDDVGGVDIRESAKTSRAYGLVDLRVIDQFDEEYEDEDGEERAVVNEEDYVYEYDSSEDIGDDLMWEMTMGKKIHCMKRGNRPVVFRLYLLDMIRYSAKINDLKCLCMYVRELQKEYGVYENYERIIKSRSDPNTSRKFRIDRASEDLIIRLATLCVGSAVGWKRTLNLICDRLQRSMEHRRLEPEDLPVMFRPGSSIGIKEVREVWVHVTVLDLTGYAIQGNREGVRLRRRLKIYLSLRPVLLVKLGLGHTGLKKDKFVKLLPFLAGLPSLQELDLRGNYLDNSIFKHIYPFLGRSGDHFRSGFPRLRWMYLNHNVDIHHLPVRFVVGLDRRWPPVDYRPTHREVTDRRASVSDFSKVQDLRERIRVKALAIEAESSRRTRHSKRHSRHRARRRRRRREAFLKTLADTNGRVPSDSSVSSSSSVVNPADVAGEAGAPVPDVDTADASALRARAARNHNDNGNNAHDDINYEFDNENINVQSDESDYDASSESDDDAQSSQMENGDDVTDDEGIDDGDATSEDETSSETSSEEVDTGPLVAVFDDTTSASLDDFLIYQLDPFREN